MKGSPPIFLPSLQTLTKELSLALAFFEQIKSWVMFCQNKAIEKFVLKGWKSCYNLDRSSYFHIFTAQFMAYAFSDKL